MPYEIRAPQSKWYFIYYTGWFKKVTGAVIKSVNSKAMVMALTEFRDKFIKLRFTSYINRAPWSYPKRSVGFNINKSRRADQEGKRAKETPSLQSILDGYLEGWDPWSNTKPPASVIKRVKEKFPGRFVFTITGQWSGLWHECRVYGKDIVRSYVRVIAGTSNGYLPLVQSGDLRKTAQTGIPRATYVTTRGIRGTLPIPFPGPRAKGVGNILRLVSDWEMDSIIKSFNKHADKIATEMGDKAPGG
jgi:hypothetical protein